MNQESRIKGLLFLFLILTYCLLNRAAFAISYPDYVGFVNDNANLYSAEFETKLNEKLTIFEKQTGGEIAVLTIKILEGESIEEYAVRLFENWNIGKAKDDNGLLLLISKDDREVRIEVGYGYEQYINDARAGDIIRGIIVPKFRQEKYEEGTEEAIDATIKYISDQNIAPVVTNEYKSEFPWWIVIIGGYLFFTYLASFLGRTKEIWPGAVIGGAMGLVFSLALGIAAALFIGFFASLFGLFLDIILSRNYKVRKEKGLPTGFWQTGGGFSSGGGFSFGGFGGGSSGGGGASGRW